MITINAAMNFKWLVVVLASAVFSDLVSAQPISCMLKLYGTDNNLFYPLLIIAVSGTCASINYTNSCCPPRRNCQAADGNCHCGADCHAMGNCCVDAHCPSRTYVITKYHNVALLYLI